LNELEYGGAILRIGHVVPGLEDLPGPLGVASAPEMVGIHDDDLPALGWGWVLSPASLVAGGDPVGGAVEEVLVAVAEKVAVMPRG
jgi:hypothetical protein